MLKKAGIVVATAAAGLLAVSPLAFAGDKDDHDHDRDHDGRKVKIEKVEKHEDSNDAENSVTGRAVAVNICNNGDIADLVILKEVWGVIPLWSEPSKSDERNCYQRAEAGHEVDQEIDQEIDD